MSRGQFDRPRQVSPFILAVVAIVIGLTAVVVISVLSHPAVAR